MALFVQTNIIEYGIMTYVYDDAIDVKSSTIAFVGLTKVLNMMSEYVDCSNLTIYMQQRRKKYITCKILSSDKSHESSFITIINRFEIDASKIAEKILDDWSKVTKLNKIHYFEIKK